MENNPMVMIADHTVKMVEDFHTLVLQTSITSH